MINEHEEFLKQENYDATYDTYREEFLARISKVLGRERSAPPAGELEALDVGVARVLDASADLIEEFCRRAAGTGMQVHRTVAAGATAVVTDVLVRSGARRVAAAFELPLEGIDAAIERIGIRAIEWREAPRCEAMFDADVGITGVDAAIAETGTLVCCERRESGRGLSLVPPVHIAVVKRSQIVADLIDYLAYAATPGTFPSADMPASIAFITGPSKTADIEGILITGVHGPREVHVVVIDDA
ncbi:MAG: Lactate utilization protein C [Phycisphaerales bacterium]|nr:Lactate utilization protein C [Phycisphaerales bacterium]